MLEYLLSPRDLGQVRFGISPLCEAGLSLKALRQPGRFPLQLTWVRQVRAELDHCDRDVLGVLVDDALSTPDFLNPRPDTPLTDLAQELAALAATPLRVFRRNLAAMHGEVPKVLAGQDGPRRVAGALADYWRVCIDPYWQRMRTVLESDIAYRGKVIADDGVQRMLNDLSPIVSFDGTRLTVTRIVHPDRSERVAGRGLTLVPTTFTPDASVPLEPGHPPMVLYAPRGQGTMWSTAPVPAGTDFAQLFGPVRARLLMLLADPWSTTGLSAALAVTPSAVNQHLRLLHRTGLLMRRRYGRSVLYQRSSLADSLLLGEFRDT